MKKITLITNTADLDKGIIAFGKAMRKIEDDAQLLLASATLQAVLHGNVNHINAIIIQAGKGLRKTAMANWLLKFAPVVLEDNREKAKDQPMKFSRDKLAELLEKHAQDAAKPTAEEGEAYAIHAFATHWTEYKEPPLVPETFDFLAAAKKLLAQATTYEGKGTKVSDPTGLRAQLAALVPQGQTS